VLLKRNMLKNAAKNLIIELKRSSDDPEMLRELAGLLQQASRLRESNIALQRLVELKPDDADAHHELAVSCFMMDKYGEGIRSCRRALKLRNNFAPALYNLALAYHKLNRPKRAKRFASRALTASPNEPQIRNLCRHLGLWSLRRIVGSWCRRALKKTRALTRAR